jgi:hypothetical protein
VVVVVVVVVVMVVCFALSGCRAVGSVAWYLVLIVVVVNHGYLVIWLID